MTIKLVDLGFDEKQSYTPSKEEDLPYIGLEHVEPNTLHLSSYGSSTEVNSSKYKFRKGDILFGTMRPYFRKLIIAPFDGVCSTEFCVIRPQNLDERDFLFYAMAQKTFIEYATTNSNGARPRTKWELFSDFKLGNFSKQERIKIGSILSAYDSLIENNRRRIQLLEKSARLLYREWFVHLRFPGHEHVRIIDGVPEGWEKGTVSNFYKTTSGGTPSRKNPDFFTGDINWVKTQELQEGFIFETDEKITEDAISNSSARLFPINTVLVAMYGATIGQTAILANPAATNQACCALFPDAKQTHYIHAYLFLRENKNGLINLSQGSAQKNISQEIIKNYQMTMPSKMIMTEFIESLEPVFVQIKNLHLQNSKLKDARDILLPRLMNGVIPV